MKHELIFTVLLDAEREKELEELCDKVAAEFAFSKRSAGLLPTGKPVGYIYSKGQDMFQLSLFGMAVPPYGKIHVRRANGEVGEMLRLHAENAYGADVQFIGASNREK